jgi:alkanesulfonate monooxygenase SsuD/methylene tetrahydromethanopterin reductase-like flavin-dependent oxidoreductase (luciferase family)
MKKVGLQLVFQNYGSQVADEKHFSQEVEIAELAEPLGMDEIWPVEHHFEDYAACPDNTQFLAYLAAKTSTIKLATGAVILPWNDPVRVVERITQLDYLSGGRAVLGIGRGLARREYNGFGVNMEESRGRFDESADMVKAALESGFIEGDGAYYPQARVEIRPRPLKSFKDRFYSVAMSPDSVLQAARLGAQMILFSNKPDEKLKESIDTYNKEYKKHHSDKPKPPRLCDFVVCNNDSEEARTLAKAHIGGYFASVMDHYELAGDHFKNSKVYQSYGDDVDVYNRTSFETLMDAYIECNLYGTPEQIIERIAHRQSVIGEYEQNICVKFGGIKQEDAVSSLKLFMSEVVPEFRSE